MSVPGVVDVTPESYVSAPKTYMVIYGLSEAWWGYSHLSQGGLCCLGIPVKEDRMVVPGSGGEDGQVRTTGGWAQDCQRPGSKDLD